MLSTYWHKQGKEPLFPDLLWSRPENRTHAGKLLILGGHAQSFAAPAEAYSEAIKAGAGTVRVLLPDSLQKTVSKLFPAAEYAPSTPSGSFAAKALAESLANASWADCVLLAGDQGKNAETAVVLEKFAEKYHGQLVVSKDAADAFISQAKSNELREQTLAILTFGQLQRFAQALKSTMPITSTMDTVLLTEWLHNATSTGRIHVITVRDEHIFVASGGQVSTTVLPDNAKIWQTKAAAHAAVWWLQNPAKTFESLTTAVHGITA